MTRSNTSGRALVLGGGGVTGIAWELGILKGLADAGVDLTDADLVVGTSAGSVVGAQVTTGRTVEDLYQTQLEPPDHEIGAKLSRLTLMRMLPPLLMLAAVRRSARASARCPCARTPPAARSASRSSARASAWSRGVIASSR